MERNFHKRWWLTSPVHQGDHGGAVKTIAQGMPCDFGGPCECACVFSFIAREAAGASSIRHSLRPPSFEGARISSKTRARGVARSRRRVWHRHCERSEAIQNLAAGRLWIASSQELLAMTGVGCLRIKNDSISVVPASAPGPITTKVSVTDAGAAILTATHGGGYWF